MQNLKLIYLGENLNSNDNVQRNIIFLEKNQKSKQRDFIIFNLY